MTDNFKQFAEALKGNEDLAKQFKAELALITEKNETEDKKEAMVKAADALGFNLTLADLEKAEAEVRELDPDEMEKVSAGRDEDDKEWCMILDYWCVALLTWY